MRSGVRLFFVLLTGGCNVYDGSLVQPAGGRAAGSGTGSDTGMGGAAGTEVGATTGGTSAGAAGDVAGSAGGDGGSSGFGGSAGSSEEMGVGGTGVAPAAGVGGAAGKMTGAAGNGGVAGSAAGGAAGSSGTKDAGSGDVGVAGDGGVVCPPGACKRVFVSSNSPVPGGNLGGVAAMDTYCQSLASTNRLGGTWKVWLSESDPMTSPSVRFTHATVPYRLLNGNIVANNWAALTSGTLAHAINVTEDGLPLGTGSYEVWTGTTITGTYSGNACANWTNATASLPNADVGVTNQTGAGWTRVYRQFCNRTTVHVYCFEQ